MESEVAKVADGPYDVLVLSPHLDDAALSVGGYLHRLTQTEGKRVLVVNVFTAEAPDDATLSRSVKKLHNRWRRNGKFKGSIMAHRRREEDAACNILGVDVLYLDFLDALYRQDAKGRPLYDPVSHVLGWRHSEDTELLHRLVHACRSLPQADLRIVPLGVGHHVDHLLVRQAAEVTWGDVVYYEDFPYAREGRQRLKAQLWRRLEAPEKLRDIGGIGRAVEMGINWLRWKRCQEGLGESDLAAKIASISCYKSQLSRVFKTPDNLEKAVHDFSDEGERLWRRRW